MRKLVTTDVFEGLRLIQKSGLKDELVPVIENLAKDPKSLERAGIIGILTVIEVFANAKAEHLIYEWLAGPFECTPEEIGAWDLGTLANNLQALTEANDLRNFFTVLSGLLTRRP